MLPEVLLTQTASRRPTPKEAAAYLRLLGLPRFTRGVNCEVDRAEELETMWLDVWEGIKDVGRALRFWDWRKIRRANIPSNVRDFFEGAGENRIRGMFVHNLVPDKKDADLLKIYNSQELTQQARQWLFELQDAHERKEQRLETVEVAILVFLALEVLHDYVLAPVFHWGR